ncbi:Bug family tripartite tricarboxylate transporter substrate binding protein [Ramlibacter montanisoli]|uniref:Tripartite tricarboxylate transporter substrate binding protein n=1 Tax=Ramlibacter montanisoli TaxID=2732512 RepID=A0A849KAC9_9BURK|nr:tripartite tricarboxylate transporter substrate binding protein [Ramlibacter montanisoli]
MTRAPTPISRRMLLAALAALGLPAHAQLWPARPLRIIVPYPTGGISDLVARAMAERLAAQLGQPVVVENKAGASGTIGMDALAKAPADGYTLAFSAISPIALSPALGKVPYDPERDFTPVASAMVSPVLLLATSALAARDFGELVARARDWPDTIRWATSGQASLGHLMLEQLQAAAKLRMVHIPYKGGGQQITDALGGQFEVLSVNTSPVLMEHIRAGRLRPLAVGGPRRLDSLPQVPTLAELGHPAANLASHFGVFAPGNLPVRLLDRLNSEVNTALEHPDVRGRLLASQNVPTGGTAREFARQIASEADNTARVVRAANIKAE